jgi:hypothetical protein
MWIFSSYYVLACISLAVGEIFRFFYSESLVHVVFTSFRLCELISFPLYQQMIYLATILGVQLIIHVEIRKFIQCFLVYHILTFQFFSYIVDSYKVLRREDVGRRRGDLWRRVAPQLLPPRTTRANKRGVQEMSFRCKVFFFSYHLFCLCISVQTASSPNNSPLFVLYMIENSQAQIR